MQLLSSLTNRIFLATATTAVFAIGVPVYFVSDRVGGEAEVELSRGLTEAGKLVEQHRATLVDAFAVEAELIADLPKLKAAVDTGDPGTVEPIASDYQALVGSDLFVVTDRSGRVLWAAGIPLPAGEAADLPGLRRALSGEESISFWPRADGVLWVISVPIAIGLGSPEILGSLSIGVLFDDDLAAQFKRLTDSDVAFAAGGQVRAATLQIDDPRAIVGLLGSTGVREITLNGDEYIALVQPLVPVSRSNLSGRGSGRGLTTGRGPLEPAGGSKGRQDRGDTGASDRSNRAVWTAVGAAMTDPPPAAVILRSRTERLRFRNALFATLGAAAVLAIVLAIGLSYGVARTVTRPLAAITAAMREMASTGDLTRKIDLPRSSRWEDEDTSLLATTFNTLTDSIARFQREAAQRERLSSLGRLSTVIAHEIRNPLMIIKASLRTIRRADVTTTSAREAVADIDEEVARLNRVVNDVLDFARPIRFELAPADLNALCAECAAATTTDATGPAIRLTPDPSLPPIVTDAERLRIALVNILVNSQHAVQAHVHGNGGDPSAALPDIEVRTGRADDGRISIVVSDRGGGINAEDAPRIFDPYFTTRRTGTGLGLAIAKNIIEGLGGTISVNSHPGHGTDMRIEFRMQDAECRMQNAEGRMQNKV